MKTSITEFTTGITPWKRFETWCLTLFATNKSKAT